MGSDRELLTLPEGAEKLGISYRTMQRLVSQGAIATVRIGRRVFVSSMAVEHFIGNGGARDVRGGRQRR